MNTYRRIDCSVFNSSQSDFTVLCGCQASHCCGPQPVRGAQRAARPDVGRARCGRPGRALTAQMPVLEVYAALTDINSSLV